MGAPGCGELQPPTVTCQIQGPIVPRILYDDNPPAGAKLRNRFVRIALPVLDVGGTADDRTGRVQHIQIVIVGRVSQGVGPKQIHSLKGASGQHRVVGYTAKIVDAATPPNRRRPAIREVPLPRTRGAAIDGTAVAGGRKNSTPAAETSLTAWAIGPS